MSDPLLKAPRAAWGTCPSDRRKRRLHPNNALYCKRWRTKQALVELGLIEVKPLLRPVS